MSTPHPIVVLAHQTWLEAWHARLPAMLIVMLVLGLATQWFVGAVSLVETRSSGLAIAAPLVRLLAVAMVASISVNLIARELTDRRIELVLSAPIERPTWVMGRFAGVAIIALAASVAAAGALAGNVSMIAWLSWWASLVPELVLVGALAVTVTVALKGYALSLLALTLLYLASRLIGVIDQLAGSGLPGLAGLSGWEAANWLTSTLALMLPRLELYAPSDWLLNEIAPGQALHGLGLGTAQFTIYLVILAAACCLDFKRDLD